MHAFSGFLRQSLFIVLIWAFHNEALAQSSDPTRYFDRQNLRVTEADGTIRTRSFLVYRPQRLSGRTPLVILFHGGSENAEKSIRHTDGLWEQLADEKGFTIAVPQGRTAKGTNEGGPRAKRYWNDCRVTDPQSEWSTWDDVAFTDQLIDWFDDRGLVDLERIYANGASNGGNMTLRLAFELAERFAGFAPSIAYGPPADDPEQNECTGPTVRVPMLLTYGTADRLNPPDIRGCKEADCRRGAQQSYDDFIDFWTGWYSVTDHSIRDIPDRVQGDGPRACETRRSSTQTQIDYLKDNTVWLRVRRVNCGGHSEPGLRQWGALARVLVGWRNLDDPAPVYITDFWGL